MSQYFDLVVHAKQNGSDQWLSLNYHQISQPVGMRPLGDVGRALLHFVNLLSDLPQRHVATINMVRYQCMPLHQFKTQLPTVLVVNHTAQVVHLIPCPVDEGTMGSNTIVALCGIQHDRDTLEAHAFETPEGLANVDMTAMSEQVKDMATWAAVRAAGTWCCQWGRVWTCSAVSIAKCTDRRSILGGCVCTAGKQFRTTDWINCSCSWQASERYQGHYCAKSVSVHIVWGEAQQWTDSVTAMPFQCWLHGHCHHRSNTGANHACYHWHHMSGFYRCWSATWLHKLTSRLTFTCSWLCCLWIP